MTENNPFVDGQLIALSASGIDMLMTRCSGCWDKPYDANIRDNSIFAHIPEKDIKTSPDSIWRVKKFSDGTVGLQNVVTGLFLAPCGSCAKDPYAPQYIATCHIKEDDTKGMSEWVPMIPEKSGDMWTIRNKKLGNYLSICSCGGKKQYSCTFHITDKTSKFILWKVIKADMQACCKAVDGVYSSIEMCSTAWGNLGLCDNFCKENPSDTSCPKPPTPTPDPSKPTPDPAKPTPDPSKPTPPDNSGTMSNTTRIILIIMAIIFFLILAGVSTYMIMESVQKNEL